MILTEEKLREFIRNLLFEEILGEPDQSREDDRDDPDDKDKDKDDDEETLTDTKKDEAVTVAGMGAGLGPMTPLGTDAHYPDTGSPSDYLRGKKRKKKRRKKKK